MLWTVVMNTFATWRESDVMGGGEEIDGQSAVGGWGGGGLKGVLSLMSSSSTVKSVCFLNCVYYYKENT